MSEQSDIVNLPDEASEKLNSSQYNDVTMRMQLIHELLNAATNWQPIVTAISEGRARDIADEPKAVGIGKEKPPAIIIGSGPSLDKSIKYLKDWKGGIFCTTSHAVTLVRHGIIPTHIVALDPFCMYSEIEDVDWSKTNTKLVATPTVYPDLIEKWPNELLLYIQSNGKEHSFYKDTLKSMYTKREDTGQGIRYPQFRFLIRTEFALFACSPPMQLFVADMLGYGTIFLAGCDFGFPDNKERFTEAKLKEAYKGMVVNPHDYGIETWEKLWDEIPHPYTKNDNTVVSFNGVLSEKVHIYYKKNFISAWRLCGKTIYTTDHGTITEIPYTDIKKLIRKQGYDYPKQSSLVIQRITDRYLATIACFVVEENHGGKLFVETVNPVEDITQYIKAHLRKWMCPYCKSIMEADDDKDYTGEACLICKTKGLKRAAEIDLDKNIERIKKLVPLMK